MHRPSLWALGNGHTKTTNVSVLCANMYQKVSETNKNIPSYMQRKDNLPLAYSFETVDLAKEFIRNEIYNNKIDTIKLFDDNQMLCKYQKAKITNPLKELVYSINLISKDDDILTDFFLTTQTQLMFITEIHEDTNGFDVNATLIDLLEHTDITLEHQHILLDRLESNYKIDI
jgi:hypothetical protein